MRRALRIGNPTVRSVEAILKNGLEKVALVEEVESKPVVHENIRGGDYFDRGEVRSSREEEEIEARYLEEERQSIIHEPRTDASAALSPRRREEEAQRSEGHDEVTSSTAASAMVMTREPLPALIGRAQVLLSRPHVVRQSGRRKANNRGGEDTQTGENAGSHTGQSTCVANTGNDNGPLRGGEDVSSREGVHEGMTCNIDERGDAPCEPRRGEM